MATPHQVADASLLGACSSPTETDYLRLTDRCNRLFEFADGRIEELREPTDSHQCILALLFSLLGADLVVEVVSPDDPERDYVQKRADYAELRIPEYWIVDPQADTITVLALDGDRYVDHGVFGLGDVASSATLGGLRTSVSDILDSARRR